MRRGLGWGARWMGGVAAVALLTHCGAVESGQEEPRGEAPASRVEQALSSTLTLTPSADAVTRPDAPDQNFGGGETLSVDQSPHENGYLRFNVTGVAGMVIHARLRLYVTGSTVDGPRLYATPNWDWQDSTLTWNRSPYATEQQLLDDKGALSSGTWADFDVSAAVHGNGDYTFILQATSADGVDFASRENSRAERRPQLVLTVDSEPNCLPRVYTKTRAEGASGDTYVSEAQPTLRFGNEPGTLSATGGDKALRDLKGTRLQELVTANDSTFAVSGFGTNVDLGGGVVGPDERIANSAFVARYSATGAHLWSRSLAQPFTGEYYSLRVHLVPMGLAGVLLGGDFAQPFQHDGVTYTPRGASDLFYLRLD
jgi:hypothetical protein